MENFKVMCSEKEIQKRIKELAEEIDENYEDKGDVVMVSVLKGGVFFTVDLMKRMKTPVTFDTVQVSSEASNDALNIKKDIDADVQGKNVIVVEDIVDSGRSLKYLKDHFQAKGANNVEIAVLMDKSEKRECDVDINYKGFRVPDKFLLGYGFDQDEKYRNLPYIGYIEE
jgi:hypoxanthine phosphoribosyltransferase